MADKVSGFFGFRWKSSPRIQILLDRLPQSLPRHLQNQLLPNRLLKPYFRCHGKIRLPPTSRNPRNLHRPIQIPIWDLLFASLEWEGSGGEESGGGEVRGRGGPKLFENIGVGINSGGVVNN